MECENLREKKAASQNKFSIHYFLFFQSAKTECETTIEVIQILRCYRFHICFINFSLKKGLVNIMKFSNLFKLFFLYLCFSLSLVFAFQELLQAQRFFTHLFFFSLKSSRRDLILNSCFRCIIPKYDVCNLI